jgi:hypothetical protein
MTEFSTAQGKPICTDNTHETQIDGTGNEGKVDMILFANGMKDQLLLQL